MIWAKDLTWQTNEYHEKKLKTAYWISLIYFFLGAIVIPISYGVIGSFNQGFDEDLFIIYSSLFFISVSIWEGLIYIEHKIILEIRKRLI